MISRTFFPISTQVANFMTLADSCLLVGAVHVALRRNWRELHPSVPDSQISSERIGHCAVCGRRGGCMLWRAGVGTLRPYVASLLAAASTA